MQSGLNLGPVQVHTTHNRGHTPEELARICLEKLIYISHDAPEVIRQQAEAYRAHMYHVIVEYMHQAVNSSRTTLCAELAKQGHGDVAELIRRL